MNSYLNCWKDNVFMEFYLNLNILWKLEYNLKIVKKSIYLSNVMKMDVFFCIMLFKVEILLYLMKFLELFLIKFLEINVFEVKVYCIL